MRHGGGRLLVFGAALGAAGLFFLARPFVSRAAPWAWRIRGPGDLVGATINGAPTTPDLLERFAVDDEGIRLRRIDEHHVSLITPPLGLPNSAGGVAGVRAALPGVSDAEPRETQVIFLWQTEPGEGYRHQAQFALVAETPLVVSFSLPAPASRLHRMGFQFRGVFDEVRIESIAIPELSTGERLRHAAGQLVAPEPIDNARINFFRGPQILGHGLNYYLVSLMAATIGACALVAALRKCLRRIDSTPARSDGRMNQEGASGARHWLSRCGIGTSGTRVVLGVALVGWLIADGLFTWNLMRQARAEIPAYRGRSRAWQVAQAEGEDIAWAYETLVSASEAGEDFAVVSDDPYTPAHRLAYLLAPQRTRRESHLDARYIVVIHSAAAEYDGERREFRLGEGPAGSAELVAARSREVYVLRRLSE